MPQTKLVQQEGPKLFIVLHGQPVQPDDLSNEQLVALAERLSDGLSAVSALIAWRGSDPTDTELCAMADYYAELERGRYTVACDALDHDPIQQIDLDAELQGGLYLLGRGA